MNDSKFEFSFHIAGLTVRPKTAEETIGCLSNPQATTATAYSAEQSAAFQDAIAVMKSYGFILADSVSAQRNGKGYYVTCRRVSSGRGVTLANLLRK